MKYESANMRLGSKKYLLCFFAAIMVGLTMSSCAVYGPDTEKKSALDVLSAYNYYPTGSVMGVELIKAQKRNTVLKGAAYVNDMLPLKFETLTLLDHNGAKILETTTLHNGDFEFKGEIMNGEYLIKIESVDYSGETKVEVNDYLLENIIIRAETSDTAP